MYTGPALSMNIVDGFLRTANILNDLAEEEEKKSAWKRFWRLCGFLGPTRRAAARHMDMWFYVHGKKSLFDKIDDFIFGETATHAVLYRLAQQETTRRTNPTAERRPGPRVRSPFPPQPAPAG